MSRYLTLALALLLSPAAFADDEIVYIDLQEFIDAGYNPVRLQRCFEFCPLVSDLFDDGCQTYCYTTDPELLERPATSPNSGAIDPN